MFRLFSTLQYTAEYISATSFLFHSQYLHTKWKHKRRKKCEEEKLVSFSVVVVILHHFSSQAGRMEKFSITSEAFSCFLKRGAARKASETEDEKWSRVTLASLTVWQMA
jgi:hypothetical protein